ncbi:MAG: hypothetical protein IKG30_06760 [Clostridiales bacterium]|nr:hypothetical protein [Clostridiales bacterium]
MCPEMNELVESKKTGKKIILVFGIAVLTLILGLSGFLIFRFAELQRIPELKRIDGLDVNYFDVSVTCYDGENYKYVSPNSRTKEESLALMDAVHKFASVKGRKVNNWTPDKITYPVYSVTISPVIFKSEAYVAGETVVWSNGYLFTASGDVYRCSPDFRSFLKTDDNDYVREADLEGIAYARAFRPLFYAGSKWHKEFLNPFNTSSDDHAEFVEAEITEISERNGFPLVTVLLTNTGEEMWCYEDRSLFVTMVVVVDGEWYYLYHDPGVDDDIRTIPGYDEILEPGAQDTVQISLGFYGTLPPGDYMILIHGEDSSGYCYACAEYQK